jgi:HEPN domain-containing protein
VVARLLKDLPIQVPDNLVEKAKVLDGFYLPTRYANSHPEGSPFEHYGSIQSTDGIAYAAEILEFARSKMA